MMLQQTPVDRVIPLYKNFLKQFPTVRVLARAPLANVLRVWQGLGYNRRAKHLWQAAQALGISRLPPDIKRLEQLAGVGPYTARAIVAFAFNGDVVLIETNIRTVVIHHFFPKKEKISDVEIEKVLEQVLPKGRSRDWYAALMDYGAYLKRSGVKLNARHARYTRQSRFSGSTREVRGAIVRELAKGSRSKRTLLGLLGGNRAPQLRRALTDLLAEGLIQKRGRAFALPR